MSAIDSLKNLFNKKPSADERNLTGYAVSEKHHEGMYCVASEECIGCRSCRNVCPQSCIDFSSVSARILPEHCVNCGRCLEVCPAGAIRKSDGSSL